MQYMKKRVLLFAVLFLILLNAPETMAGNIENSCLKVINGARNKTKVEELKIDEELKARFMKQFGNKCPTREEMDSVDDFIVEVVPLGSGVPESLFVPGARKHTCFMTVCNNKDTGIFFLEKSAKGYGFFVVIGILAVYKFF